MRNFRCRKAQAIDDRDMFERDSTFPVVKRVLFFSKYRILLISLCQIKLLTLSLYFEDKKISKNQSCHCRIMLRIDTTLFSVLLVFVALLLYIRCQHILRKSVLHPNLWILFRARFRNIESLICSSYDPKYERFRLTYLLEVRITAVYYVFQRDATWAPKPISASNLTKIDL